MTRIPPFVGVGKKKRIEKEKENIPDTKRITNNYGTYKCTEKCTKLTFMLSCIFVKIKMRESKEKKQQQRNEKSKTKVMIKIESKI